MNLSVLPIHAEMAPQWVPEMEKLPLLISVPHAGLQIPPEVDSINLLSLNDIIQDGDVGAAEIYGPLKEQVRHFVSMPIARAYVDLNRAEDDIRIDGIVKTHTCWNVPIYEKPLSQDIIQQLITRYHRPYHRQLTAISNKQVILAIDCHTMAEYGPPVGPDTGIKRPLVCLGNVNGQSCPDDWLEYLAVCFADQFDGDVTTNKPFSGGYITQNHGTEMPWIQLELSRSEHISMDEKGARVLAALHCWCSRISKST